MQAGKRTYALLPIIVAAYWIGGFYPFELDPPSSHENGLRRGPEGSFDFVSPGIAHTVSAPEWIPSTIQQQSLTVSLTACSYYNPQVGPARIITISKDPWLRNLTIGQDGADLIVRLRRHGSDLNGLPPYIVPDVFKDSTCRAIQVAIEPLRMTINVDGTEMLATPLDAGSLDTWDRNFRFAIGNELTNDRPWLGSVQALIAGPASTSKNYLEASSLMFPERLRHLPRRLRSLIDSGGWITTRSDATLNVMGFLPLPFLLVAAAISARRKYAILTIAILVSLSIELGQIFFANRYPSLGDLAFNTLGAALGILLLRIVTVFRTRA